MKADSSYWENIAKICLHSQIIYGDLVETLEPYYPRIYEWRENLLLLFYFINVQILVNPSPF